MYDFLVRGVPLVDQTITKLGFTKLKKRPSNIFFWKIFYFFSETTFGILWIALKFSSCRIGKLTNGIFHRPTIKRLCGSNKGNFSQATVCWLSLNVDFVVVWNSITIVKSACGGQLNKNKRKYSRSKLPVDFCQILIAF